MSNKENSSMGSRLAFGSIMATAGGIGAGSLYDESSKYVRKPTIETEYEAIGRILDTEIARDECVIGITDGLGTSSTREPLTFPESERIGAFDLNTDSRGYVEDFGGEDYSVPHSRYEIVDCGLLIKEVEIKRSLFSDENSIHERWLDSRYSEDYIPIGNSGHYLFSSEHATEPIRVPQVFSDLEHCLTSTRAENIDNPGPILDRICMGSTEIINNLLN